jgi:ABC-type dipeptide/oligopeptide/nickel transport system permease component
LVFAVHLRLLPVAGIGSWRHVLMPAFTLGWFFTAALLRLSRSTMLDVLDSEYIKMARIKGVPEKLVILKHAWKNASIPVISLAALNFVFLINGTVITEMIFAWPGVGRLVVDSIYARDFPMIQACALISSFMYVFANLIVDVTYAYIDPRIRYQ